MDAPEHPLAPPAERPGAPSLARPAWLTYAQAGERLGLTPEAVRHRARRAGWRTMPGNDGRTLVLVPDDVEPARTPAQTSDHTPDQSDEIARAYARAEQAEQRADQANKRADVAIALADRTLVRVDRAEKVTEIERARADRAEQRADRAEAEAAELRRADAARRGKGRWARLRSAWRGE
jgi:hypothetical protein